MSKFLYVACIFVAVGVAMMVVGGICSSQYAFNNPDQTSLRRFLNTWHEWWNITSIVGSLFIVAAAFVLLRWGGEE